MFLKTGELKKLMKSSLKRQQLKIGRMESEMGDYYLICSDLWGLKVDEDGATNKFKAAIMELVGEIPQRGRCQVYEINPDTGIACRGTWDFPDPYQDWLQAKDSAKDTPLVLTVWPQEYRIYQRESDKGYLAVPRVWTDSMFSSRELEDGESMPGQPSLLRTGEGTDILYFKNQTSIYWIYSINPGEKSRKTLFLQLEGMDFSEKDWILKKDNEGRIKDAEGLRPEGDSLPD